MSTQTTSLPAPVAKPDGLRALAALRVAGLVAAIAVVVNVLVHTAARGLGADFAVVRPGEAAVIVDLPTVAIMTLAPLAVGTLALAVATRWDARGWVALAWVGLAIGVLSIVVPLGIDAEAGTKTAMASMHVLTGVIWFALLRRQVRQVRQTAL